MCEEGGSPVRKFCPTHLPLASHNLEELLFPASLSPLSQDWGDIAACWNPRLSELVDIRLCQGPTASLQLAGTEPFCRDEIVMNWSSLDRLWLSSPRKPRQRLDRQPGDQGSRHP